MKITPPPADGVPTALTAVSSSLGERIRFARQQRGMSLEQLATATGLTKSYLSKVERQLAVPSITTALKVSRVFGQTVGQLLGESLDESSLCIVRKNERHRFLKNDTHNGYNIEAIASSLPHKRMEPFVMRPPHKFHSDRRFTHAGEELIFVLSGQIEIEFIDRTVLLEAGDALYFNSHNPHRSRSIGETRAEALVVVLNQP
ncbi:XRE family transcriptional regulator [Afipia carboxidovorans]|nr:XRE family transcriptional regulator [Afipia carboxidovorans]